MVDSPEPNRPQVGAVANAAKILAHLGAAATPLRLTQISRPLGINTSTCLNILRTLAAEGFVRLEPATKTYGLGRRIVELARHALNQGENLGTLRPAMDTLAEKHRITVMLWGRIGDEHLVLLAASIGDPLQSIHAELGLRVPLLTGSMGRLFASGLEPVRLRRMFDAIVWQKPLDFDTYQRQVAEAAERGWAIDAGHLYAPTWGISIPISQPGAPADRALNAVFLEGQRDPAAIEHIAEELLAVGRG